MKHFILKISLAVMAVSIMLCCAVTVCALDSMEYEDISARQTAYDDYYDDHYDERYDDDKHEKNHIAIIGGAFLISAVITGLAVGGIYRGYKYNGRTEPYPYNRKAPLELTGKEDVMIDRQIRREKIERERK